eukprot:TRINITY_DN1995_c0_g1_i1.p1 TRINITY_DN1995_c0_g1~~TRINITY_DN1995_c0_g1_i1.p1  ORF type:complete len:295 (+),score=84.37 TRINITY_DN1995_c0_g1_i1:220-1104(+)
MARNLAALIEDLKNSWYFRIWFLLWIGAVIAGFGAMIFYGDYATKIGNEKTIRDYTYDRSQQNLPDIEFRLHWNHTETYTIENVQCYPASWGYQFFYPMKLQVPVTECDKSQNFVPGACRLVKASGLTVYNTSMGIFCSLVAQEKPGTPSLNDTTRVVGLSIPAERWHRNYVTWAIGGHELVAVRLRTHLWDTKGGITYDKTDSVIPPTYDPVNAPALNEFQWFVHFEDLNELHTVTDQDEYPRMLSAADIGGFAFLLYILHTIVMFFVGFVLVNNSTFLNGETNSNRSSYANL